jgi:flagellar biosynthesis/type III secretory pathway protein FliH
VRLVRGGADVRRLSLEEVEARERADAIVTRAQEKAAAWRDEARAAGRAEAYAEAAATLVAARLAYESATRADEPRVIALALEIARAALEDSARVDESVVRASARRALSRLRRARCLVLRVHPEDAGAVGAAVRAWLPDGAAPETLDVLADGAVARGGVVVESELGRVDATLDTTLAALAKALRSDD